MAQSPADRYSCGTKRAIVHHEEATIRQSLDRFQKQYRPLLLHESPHKEDHPGRLWKL